MQKLIYIALSAALLSACYCKCSPEGQRALLPEVQQPQPAPVTQQQESVTSVPATEKTAQLPAPAPTSIHQPDSAPATPSTSSANTQTDAQPSADAGFTPQEAELLIAQQRAAQTLQEPPAQPISFKKEETLPTQGRLLSPLAYEPVLPDNTHAPWSNENLKYGLYYSFVKAGTAYIKTRGITEHNGKKAYLIQTTAFSSSAIDAVFRVRDINFSWLDVQTHTSLGYSQSLREGNYVRDEWTTFEPENNRFYGEVRKKKDTRPFAGELDQPVLDMLSSLYFVRSQPLATGHDITLDIINREEHYPLVVKVLGKETVKTKAGKFDCWIVEPQFRGEGIFVAKGKSLKVWLTDDQYRMPVKMSVEVFIGSVHAELLEYQRN